MRRTKVLVAAVFFRIVAGEHSLSGEEPPPIAPGWSVRLDFPVHAIDDLSAVACDGATGNTYAAGRSSRIGWQTDYDWLLVAYGPGGDRLWTASHGGPWGWYDTICGIAVGPDGAICLAGTVGTMETDSDFAAVKYDSGGRELWAVRPPRMGPEEASAMVMDASGNLYITGGTMVDLDHWDFRTVKIGPVGDFQWQALHDGPAHRSDRAHAIAIGPDGMVIVAGTVEVERPDGEPGATESSCALVAYRPDGNVAWETAVPAAASGGFVPASVAAAPSGDVYVTGPRAGEVGLLTIAIRGGRLLWADAGTTGDTHGAVAVSEDGDAYVAGFRSVTRYAPDGAKVWIRQPPVDGLSWGAVDRFPLTVGASGITSFLEDQVGNVCVVRHSPDGTEVWRRTEVGWTDPETRRSPTLAVDGLGNVHAAGTVSSGRGDADGIVSAYGSDGLTLWSDVHDGSGRGNEMPASIAIDGRGNAIAAATIEAGMQSDIAIVKVDPSGALLWSARWGFPGGGEDRVSRAVVDLAGNITVVGVTGWLPQRLFVLKYDPDGELLWSAAGGPKFDTYQVRDVVLEEDGGVAAAAYEFSEGRFQATVVKHRADGTEAWARGEADVSPSVAAAGSGGVLWLAGSTVDGSEDFLLWRYDRDGNLIGKTRHDVGGRDIPLGLVLDGEGNGFVTGFWADGDERRNLVLMRFGPGGDLLWEKGFAGCGEAVALDPSGNPCIAGVQVRPDGTRSLVIAKYGRDGDLLWVRKHGEEGTSEEGVRGLEIDAAGNLYVAADLSTGRGSGMGCVFLKYDPEGDLIWSGSERSIGDVFFRVDSGENLIFAGTVPSSLSEKDLTVSMVPTRAGGVPFIRGDCDGDRNVGGVVTDAVVLLEFNFLGGERPSCLSACDANGDGRVVGEVTDAIYLLRYGFLGGPAPPAPFPSCGFGPDDEPGCSAFPECAGAP